MRGRSDGIPTNRIDLREQILDIAKQDVITRDNVEMNVDTLVFYQIVEPHKTVYEISSPVDAIRQLSRTSIRNVFGEMDLDATLSARESINAKLRTVLDEATDKWGIKVLRVEVQDISPPPELKETMQKQMVAERDRRAQVTLAEAEKQAVILKAEGDRQNQILRAEGEKQSVVLRAEAEKQESVLVAEGQAEAIRMVQQATAAGLDMVRDSLSKKEGTRGVIALETLKAQTEIANRLATGESTKIFLPTEVAGLFGALGGVKEILRSNVDGTEDGSNT